MALIVAPALAADSYCSVASADVYHAARGNSVWTLLTPTAKEQALVKSSDYLRTVYAGRWVAGVGDMTLNPVPPALAQACAVLALKSTAVELLPDLEAQVLSESVGPISVSYQPGARQQVKFQAVEALLKPLLQLGGMNMIRLERA